MTACSTQPSPVDEALFRIQACGGQFFHVLIRDPDVIREAEGLIGGPDQKMAATAAIRASLSAK